MSVSHASVPDSTSDAGLKRRRSGLAKNRPAVIEPKRSTITVNTTPALSCLSTAGSAAKTVIGHTIAAISAIATPVRRVSAAERLRLQGTRARDDVRQSFISAKCGSDRAVCQARLSDARRYRTIPVPPGPPLT